MTRDGTIGSIVGSNAYNLLLDYYNGDYKPISTAAAMDNGVNTTFCGDYRPLFNGNISSMGVDLKALNHPLLYNYQYDQLNRLVQMDAWNNTGSTWSSSTKISDFQERVSYDPNGNILNYKRNGNNAFAGTPLGMGSLHYKYIAGTNKLDHVTDSVSFANYDNDIDSQTAGNYAYDKIGNLVKDSVEGIIDIQWNLMGKSELLPRVMERVFATPMMHLETVSVNQ